jgi:hypothetical protein
MKYRIILSPDYKGGSYRLGNNKIKKIINTYELTPEDIVELKANPTCVRFLTAEKIIEMVNTKEWKPKKKVKKEDL